MLGKSDRAQWAVRRGKWKLLGNVRDTTNLQKPKTVAKLFLEDLSQDISETTNVAADDPEIVCELKAFADSQRQAVTK